MEADAPPTTPINVLLVHAYSRANSGDGLLVEESAALVREALPGAKVGLLALAPETFPEFPEALHPIHGPGQPSLRNLARAARGRLHPLAEQQMRSADLIVAVGGGYLRGDGLVPLLKTWLAHFPQLPSARQHATIYLPQSVGPFTRAALPLRRLSRARAVFVRDDRSLSFLAAMGVPAQREPDLALLSPKLQSLDIQNGQGFALVARALSRGGSTYENNIRALQRELQAAPVIQSAGRGNNDPAFYGNLGFGEVTETLRQLLGSGTPPAVVISVRLHGSLQSLHSGVPTIHLSYERKGWGAFSDLGLDQYVHSARNFSPKLVIEQAQQLARDPSEYWRSVTKANERLVEARRRVLAAIQQGVQ